ncbi:MAG TPA: hypothetical protein PLD70_12305 [Thermotogota bacterium]|nr:hypothetical protein [Thermotogota bacterium]
MINVNESATRIEEITYVFIPVENTSDDGSYDPSYGHPQLITGKAEYRSGQLYMLSGRPAPSRLSLQNGGQSEFRYDNMGVYIFSGDIK